MVTPHKSHSLFFSLLAVKLLLTGTSALLFHEDFSEAAEYERGGVDTDATFLWLVCCGTSKDILLYMIKVHIANQTLASENSQGSKTFSSGSEKNQCTEI